MYAFWFKECCTSISAPYGHDMQGHDMQGPELPFCVLDDILVASTTEREHTQHLR